MEAFFVFISNIKFMGPSSRVSKIAPIKIREHYFYIAISQLYYPLGWNGLRIRFRRFLCVVCKRRGG